MKYIIWMIAMLVWTPCLAATSTHHVTPKTKHHVAQAHKNSQRAATKKAVHRKGGATTKKKKHLTKKQKVTVSQASESTAALGAPIRPIVTTPSPYRTGFVSSLEQRLVEFVHKTVDGARYTAYKLGGRHFDASRGVYVLDCSDYVDNVLAAVNPKAYWSLADSAGSDKPTSEHYYEFFRELGNNPSYYWNQVSEVEGLRPGDILVFRKKAGFSGRRASGHVMVVMSKPVWSEDAYLVRVADSAPVGHSEDTRQDNSSGIGIGTLLLKEDSRTGKPLAYAWKVGSRWTGNVNIAMARPMARS